MFYQVTFIESLGSNLIMIAQSKVAAQSKPLSFFDAIPYTCYECGHTWEPRCHVVFFQVLRDAMKFSVKVYIGFYMVS